MRLKLNKKLVSQFCTLAMFCPAASNEEAQKAMSSKLFGTACLNYDADTGLSAFEISDEELKFLVDTAMSWVLSGKAQKYDFICIDDIYLELVDAPTDVTKPFCVDHGGFAI